MAWSPLRTWVTGEVVRARYFNTDVRDNEVALAGVYAEILTDESTTSLTYVNLATQGPVVSVPVTGAQVFVAFGAVMLNTTASDGAAASPAFSGATTVAAADGLACSMISVATSRDFTTMRASVKTGLTPGPHAITLQYRAVTGGTARFRQRWLCAVAAG